MIVQELAGLGDAVLGRVVELRLEDEADGVAHRQHAADARGDRTRQIERFEIGRRCGRR